MKARQKKMAENKARGYYDENKELKLCPFCGGKAKIMMLDENGFDVVDIAEIGNGVDDNNDTFICCEKCDTQNSISESASSAITAWNKRTNATRD